MTIATVIKSQINMKYKHLGHSSKKTVIQYFNIWASEEAKKRAGFFCSSVNIPSTF